MPDTRSIPPILLGGLFLVVSSFGVLDSPVHAQAPGVPIESFRGLWEDVAVMEAVEKIHADGESLDVREARQALRDPTPTAVKLASPGTRPLEAFEVADRARSAFLRLGWYGGDDEANLGLLLGAAFMIDDDLFVTCRHVVAPGKLKAGCLVAVDLAGKAYRVKEIVAADRTADVAIVRIEGTNCQPIPLATDVSPGDRVYCFSEPLDAYGYFDEGIVNRFFRLPPPARRAVPEDSPALVRMHVSVDWAPGSSGSATLDRFGNAIGIVCAIQSLSEDFPFIPYEGLEPQGGTDDDAPALLVPPILLPKIGATADEGPDEAVEEESPKKKRRRAPAPTLMILHEATPAKAALDLIEATNAAAQANGADDVAAEGIAKPRE